MKFSPLIHFWLRWLQIILYNYTRGPRGIKKLCCSVAQQYILCCFCSSECNNKSNKMHSVISVLEGGGSVLDPQSTPSLHETLSRLREKNAPHTHTGNGEGLRPSPVISLFLARALSGIAPQQQYHRRLQIFRRNSHIRNFISTSSARRT